MNCVENLDGEIWRYVMSEEIGFWPYMVSNMGRVKSLNFRGNTGKEQIRVQKTNKQGYLYVRLWRNGKGKYFTVHRLVALMFIKNPDNLPSINHKDEDKSNNCLENLEFCSIAYNNAYNDGVARRQKKRKETLKTSVAWAEGNAKKMKKVFQYNQNFELLNVFPSLTSIEKQKGFDCSTICDCCNGKRGRKTAYGFIWSYEPLPNSTNQLSLFPTTETEKKIS